VGGCGLFWVVLADLGVVPFYSSRLFVDVYHFDSCVLFWVDITYFG